MTSLTITADKEDISKECMENFADWLLIEQGWLGFTNKILINNREYYNIDKHGEQYTKLREIHQNTINVSSTKP